MTRFRVWAPAARDVALALGDGRQRIPMERGDRGWWSVDSDAPAGTDYRYAVDGADPLPDPRSPWQPEGVHGPSRTVDHSAFGWTDGGFRAPPLASAVVYELHVGTFNAAGTFDAAIERLDHLVTLGITHVELLPVNEFAGERGWGYDGVDLYAPHHAYGGPDALKRLVDACHARGLAVLLDVVYNHLGPAGNYLGRFGPYFTDRYHTPWGEAVNYDDSGSDEVRRFVIDNALMWLRDYHFDGLRLDAVHAIFDMSATHVLEEIGAEVAGLSSAVARSLVLIAESDLNDPRVVRERAAGGFGMDAQWSDDFHHALHSVLTGESDGYYADFGSLAQLATALRDAFVYAGGYSAFRDRRHGRAPVGVAGHRFLGYLQDHDQIGNRAQGERSSHLMSLGRAKVGAALVLCSPFVPMLFQGEEWAASTPFQYFSDHEPDLGRLVSEGRRSEFESFGWDPEQVPDPQSVETFRRSILRWEELEQEPHREMLEWHRALIALRRSRPELLDGDREGLTVDVDEQERTLSVRRGAVLVAVNLGESECSVALPGGAHELLLASDLGISLRDATVTLPADSVAVIDAV